MILIVDDDISIRASLSFMLKRAKYEVMAVASPKEAIAAIRMQGLQLILLDMNFSLTTSGEEGMTLLKEIKILRPNIPVILMTAWGSIDLAVKGMKAGAFDFITKPWHNVSLLQRIETALKLSASAESSDSNNNDIFDRSFIIGNSKGMNDVLNIIKRIAKTNASVLITGESGTGKELIAEALHRNSLRKNNNFVKVNLGGISQTLFESEMFGYKKGAFTDAVYDRVGRFEIANKGTIFLDEIGDLDLGSQVKLLRVLQDQTFEPLGDSYAHKVDVRIVSATNADLAENITRHTFREDLYYRISLINVHLPALRERREDIPLLVRHFAKKQCKNNNLPIVDFSQDAMSLLDSLPYWGNIRELKNIIERTILICGKTYITAKDIEPQLNTIEKTSELSKDGRTLDDIERQTITDSMIKHNNNLSRVAQDLGLSRSALYRRLDKYNIKYKK